MSKFTVDARQGNPPSGSQSGAPAVFRAQYENSHNNNRFQTQNPEATRSFDDKDNVPFLSCGTLTDKCVEKLCELCWDKNSFSLGKIMVPEQKICQSIP